MRAAEPTGNRTESSPPNHRDNAPTVAIHGSEQAKIHPVRREVPLVLQGLTPRPDHQMLRVDSAVVIEAMPDHIVATSPHLVKDAEDEAASRQLPPHEPDLPSIQRWRFDAAGASCHVRRCSLSRKGWRGGTHDRPFERTADTVTLLGFNDKFVSMMPDQDYG